MSLTAINTAQVTQLTDRVCTVAPTTSKLIFCVGWESCVKEHLASTQLISACSALCCAQASAIFFQSGQIGDTYADASRMLVT